MRLAAPALAVIATVVALFGPWFTRTTQITGRTHEATLLEVIQGTSFVEYASQQWLWISGAGVLIVLLSGVVDAQKRKRFAQGGGVLMLLLPGWSLFQVFVGDEPFSAGWAMWIAAALAAAVVVLARMIPEPETPAAPEVMQQT